MAYSFQYPPLLLHRIVEPQWFPGPKEERESSLDRLERDEEMHLEVIRRMVLPVAPEPIGIAGSTDEVKLQYPTPSPFDDNLLLPPPPQEPFWEKYKEEINKHIEKKGRLSEVGTSFDNLSNLLEVSDTISKTLQIESNSINDSSMIDVDCDNDTIQLDVEDTSMEITRSASSLLKYQRPLFSPITSIRRLDPTQATSRASAPVADTSSFLDDTTIDSNSTPFERVKYNSATRNPFELPVLSRSAGRGTFFSPSYTRAIATTSSKSNQKIRSPFGLDSPTSRTG